MRIAKRILLPLILLGAFMMGACGGTDSNAATTPISTPTPHISHAGQSADQILQGLKSKGMPIGASFTYTASNDSNHLLGRPSQYVGKVNFRDTRIASDKQGADISVDDGGAIEVFANITDAQTRANYVKAISTSSPLFAEYEYLDGLVLLRLSTQLTPEQAGDYQAVLKSLP